MSWQARQSFLAFVKDSDPESQNRVIRYKTAMLDRHTLYYNQFGQDLGPNSIFNVIPPAIRLSVANLSHTAKASIRGILIEHAGKFLGEMA